MAVQYLAYVGVLNPNSECHTKPYSLITKNVLTSRKQNTNNLINY